MIRKSHWVALPLVLGLAAAARPAAAQSFQVFTDRSAFNTAAGNQLQAANFEQPGDGTMVPELTPFVGLPELRMYPGIVFDAVKTSADDLDYDNDLMIVSVHPDFPSITSQVLAS